MLRPKLGRLGSPGNGEGQQARNWPRRASAGKTIGAPMQVKGTAFIVRMRQIAEKFGEEAWEAFLADLANKDPFFEQTIVATSMLPVEKILFLNDEVLRVFYHGDPNTYWAMGETGAV